jgi:hypothetical protein
MRERERERGIERERERRSLGKKSGGWCDEWRSLLHSLSVQSLAKVRLNSKNMSKRRLVLPNLSSPAKNPMYLPMQSNRRPSPVQIQKHNWGPEKERLLKVSIDRLERERGVA